MKEKKKRGDFLNNNSNKKQFQIKWTLFLTSINYNNCNKLLTIIIKKKNMIKHTSNKINKLTHKSIFASFMNYEHTEQTKVQQKKKR